MQRIRIAIAGMGSRGEDCYGKALMEMRDRAEITAIAEPRSHRRSAAAEEFGLDASQCYESAEALLEQPRLADVLLICTQDRQHVPEAITALRKGYHILMEKPISPDIEDLKRLVRAARQSDRKIAVCHVLRYTPFFRRIKQAIDSDEIGEVMAIQTIENVCYWHQAHSFVRGNWRRSEETSPMIMQKCCHDLDYLVWLCGDRCARVSSFGTLKHFRPEYAPEGAAMRCLDGCGAKERCPYDAEKIYLTNEATGVLRGHTDWPANVLALHPDEASIRRAIAEGPYGRCVYHCDNDVVDHQVVNMEMERGATLTLTMSAFTSLSSRTLIVMGTKGDIRGDMKENTLRICRFGEAPEIIDVSRLSDDFSGHGGGDKQLLRQYLDWVAGGEPDSSITTLEASVESHLMALAAEESRKNAGMCVEIAPMRG